MDTDKLLAALKGLKIKTWEELPSTSQIETDYGSHQRLHPLPGKELAISVFEGPVLAAIVLVSKGTGVTYRSRDSSCATWADSPEEKIAEAWEVFPKLFKKPRKPAKSRAICPGLDLRRLQQEYRRILGDVHRFYHLQGILQAVVGPMAVVSKERALGQAKVNYENAKANAIANFQRASATKASAVEADTKSKQELSEWD